MQTWDEDDRVAAVGAGTLCCIEPRLKLLLSACASQLHERGIRLQ